MFMLLVVILLVARDHKVYESKVLAKPGTDSHTGGGKELSGRHDAGGGVFRVTQKTVSFTIVLLGGHLQDLTN